MFRQSRGKYGWRNHRVKNFFIEPLHAAAPKGRSEGDRDVFKKCSIQKIFTEKIGHSKLKNSTVVQFFNYFP